jgi:hypothetical protein
MHDSITATHPMLEQGINRQRAARQRAAIQREIGRLLDELAPEQSLRHETPAPAVTRHRTPGRCILQGAQAAVSVSWFPGRADDDGLGELIVINWRGVVSLPGSAQRATSAAVPVDTLLFRPVESESASWEWHAESGARALDTDALATYCRALLDQ